MAQFNPRVAQTYNEAIAAGLSEEEAERAAGITDANAYLYEVGTNGNLQQAVVGPGLRPNETIVPAGQSIDDDEPTFRTTVTSQSTTTTQNTQITGGDVTTRRVVPTQYENNATSNAIQSQANDLEAQKQARATAIKAAGGTGADVLRDPEFRRLSNEQTAKEYEAQQARTPVPNTGGVVTTVTPGANQTTTTQTVDGNFVTTRGSGFDAQAQAIDANQSGVVPARNFSALDVTDPGEIPGVTVSDRLQTDPGEVPGETVFGPSLAQDTGGVPTQQLSTAPTPVAAQQPEFDEFPSDTTTDDTFAGNGYGFTYDEDGELLPFDSEPAESARAQPSDTQDTFAGDGYGFTYDEDGELIPSDSADAERINNEAADFEYAGDGYGFEYNEDGELIPADDPFEPDAFDPDAVSPDSDPAIPTGQVGGATADDIAPGTAAANQFRANVDSAKQQAKIQERYNQTTQGDWRVRIRLLPEADYLYSDPQDAGILAPLRNIGVIFPYVPRVSTSYVADYDKYNLTHSNYRGYFYKNSSVQEINIEGDFTAQDTKEAEYTLAVIHFFRSVTKMFYGQDKYRGSPPPLVELSGFGQYQFNNHPCLVSQFQYALPDNVDYIRVSPNNQALTLANRRPAISSSPTPTVSSILRKITNGLNDGAETPRQDLGVVQQTASGLGQTTYVPTKMRINITLLPVQNRQQVSQLFSLKEFANGRLLRGGFW